MPSTKEIRGRIKSVKNTSQITRAMQLVASSKMKKAQDMAKAGHPYAALLANILAALGDKVTSVSHPFLEARETKTRGILVISTEKGLCGPLNSNLFRELPNRNEPVKYYVIGRKGRQFLSRSQLDMVASFNVSDSAKFAEVRPVCELMVNDFKEGKIDTVEVLFPLFKNTLIQTPSFMTLLPINNIQEVADMLADQHGITKNPDDNREIKIEPSPEEVLFGLLELYIKREMYQLVLDSKASEHSARMVAMKTATDNALKLVGDLTLQYNKARQAAITQEILEITAAAAS